MKRYKYGDDSQQFAQLHRPNNGKLLPVVIVIHGGYWKDNHSLDSYPTKAIVNNLALLDVAVWNLEYRRINAEGDNLAAQWPTVFLDVIEGIDYLTNIETTEQLDLNRVLIIGHSAGGHLATWAACREQINPASELYRANPLKINRLISIAGILDLRRTEDIEQPRQINKLLGGDLDKLRARYSACDPNQLHNKDIAITVIHGDRDKTVDISQAHSYCVNAGSNVKLVVLPGADHFGMLPLDGVEQPFWSLQKDIIHQEINRLSTD